MFSSHKEFPNSITVNIRKLLSIFVLLLSVYYSTQSSISVSNVKIIAILAALILVGGVQYLTYYFIIIFPLSIAILSTKIFAVIIPLAIIYDLISRRHSIKFKNKRIFVLYAVIVGIELVNIVSYLPSSITATLILFIVFFFFLYALTTNIEYNHTFAIMCLLASICLSIYQMVPIGGFQIDLVLQDRLSGYRGNANIFAMAVCMLISFIPTLIYRNKKYKRTFIILFVILIFLGSATVSKTFLLSIVLILMLLMLQIQRINLKVVLPLIILLGLAIINQFGIIATYLVRVSDYYSYRIGIGASIDATTFSTGRNLIYAEYIQKIFGNIPNLLIGNGIQEYPLRMKINMGNSAHNVFLELLASWGIIGTITFIYLIKFLINSELKIEFIKFRDVFRFKNLNIFPLIILFIWLQSNHLVYTYCFYVFLFLAIKNISYGLKRS